MSNFGISKFKIPKKEITYNIDSQFMDVSNFYGKVVINFLSPHEFVVLYYMIQGIDGWDKEADRVSISQIQNGVWYANGDPVRFGTGLDHRTIRAALGSLQSFGLVEQLEGNDKVKNEGALWRLEKIVNNFKWDAIEARLVEKGIKTPVEVYMKLAAQSTSVNMYDSMPNQITPPDINVGGYAPGGSPADIPPDVYVSTSNALTELNLKEKEKEKEKKDFKDLSFKESFKDVVPGNNTPPDVYVSTSVATPEIIEHAKSLVEMKFDKLLNTPELKIFVQVTGIEPAPWDAKFIHDFIQDKNYSADYLQPFWNAWKESKKPPYSLAWLSNWAFFDCIPAGN